MQEIRVGTLLPNLATPIGAVAASLIPETSKPTHYQIDIFTRSENLTEWLFVTPKLEDSPWSESYDLVNQKTNVWLSKDAERAMKQWKNWPEWWK